MTVSEIQKFFGQWSIKSLNKIFSRNMIFDFIDSLITKFTKSGGQRILMKQYCYLHKQSLCIVFTWHIAGVNHLFQFSWCYKWNAALQIQPSSQRQNILPSAKCQRRSVCSFTLCRQSQISDQGKNWHSFISCYKHVLLNALSSQARFITLESFRRLFERLLILHHYELHCISHKLASIENICFFSNKTSKDNLS